MENVNFESLSYEMGVLLYFAKGNDSMEDNFDAILFAIGVKNLVAEKMKEGFITESDDKDSANEVFDMLAKEIFE